MSNAHGEVIVDEKVIGYFEYNGSADFARPAVQKTLVDVHAHWRSKGNHRECRCASPDVVQCILWSSYGYGFHWDSGVCLACMTIVGCRIPDCENTTDGYPLDEMSETALWLDNLKQERSVR